MELPDTQEFPDDGLFVNTPDDDALPTMMDEDSSSVHKKEQPSNHSLSLRSKICGWDDECLVDLLSGFAFNFEFCIVQQNAFCLHT